MQTYTGLVKTPLDAIILFEACRLGILPRVQRRLSDHERNNIQPGSVFVWDEREAGMRRWTDGKSWSASRVSGSFLTYREMEGKRKSSRNHHSSRSTSPQQKRQGGSGADEDSNGTQTDDSADDEDVSSSSGLHYKPNGLVKQSFSITTSFNQKLHLISYASAVPDPSLSVPSSDPNLAMITVPYDLYPDAGPPILQPPKFLAPYDIPVEKVAFSEDARVLDKLRQALFL
ncbi:cAMP-independent regulatory protein Pac2 [Schizosaccharomyces japonicus yFS275]|uniref:cAMP-independent regulatory protein Pac2 n=1 Tax=Schizosaccharomyces japonicus (strain yFS275 / FY16936) TaxID=402676 RepID=B6K1J1_SCHJY|nr:cAMP-independent regulatory protein Pac2 [Schizosaccharomyces japonicus yFS275]EEB07812.1 cAMP-independent regulatory protein Pac2 [Schizosaccharomyces japonicus yFS275]